MSEPSFSATRRLFEHERVAHGYATAPARDPIITVGEAARNGFARPLQRDFASSWSFTAAQYAVFLTTESNVIAAVEFGSRTADDVRAWLERELAPLFGDRPRRVAFGGYLQALRKI